MPGCHRGSAWRCSRGCWPSRPASNRADHASWRASTNNPCARSSRRSRSVSGNCPPTARSAPRAADKTLARRAARQPIFGITSSAFHRRHLPGPSGLQRRSAARRLRRRVLGSTAMCLHGRIQVVRERGHRCGIFVTIAYSQPCFAHTATASIFTLRDLHNFGYGKGDFKIAKWRSLIVLRVT